MKCKDIFNFLIKKKLLAIIRIYKAWGILNLLKYIEIILLKKFASTYCFGRPDTAMIELTNHCNLKCTFCYRLHNDLRNKNLGHMSYEHFKNIVDTIGKVKRLYLCWGGETLLNKNALEMMRYVALQKKVSNYGFVTNGLLLNREISASILKIPVGFVVISLDGGDAETHEGYRSGADFKKIINNLYDIAMLKRRFNSNTRIEISSVLTVNNLESLRKIPFLVKDMGIKRWSVQDVCIRTKDAQHWKPGSVEQFEKEMWHNCRELGIEFWHYRFDPIGICLQPFRFIGVTWDGKVTPCCNIETMSLVNTPYDIHKFWNGPAIRRWRKKMLTRKYPDICQRNCELIGFERTLRLK